MANEMELSEIIRIMETCISSRINAFLFKLNSLFKFKQHLYYNVDRWHVGTLTVPPLPGGWVDDAKEFVVGDRFGVEVHSNGLLLHVLVGS